MFSTSDLRKAYLEFFVGKDHTNVESSSLVPDNDPTLMFTNSGMVQFKDVFTGKKVLPYKRATSAQKSLRAGGKHNDLDNVGYTARHHTFFEMLGNFSFGDYFKEEAISFAWEFVSKILKLPQEKLLVTVHSSDEEAAILWHKIAGFHDSKILRIPTSDNFWTMGDTGPCGPCSEIFYDHGEEIKGGLPGTPDEDGDRFIEIWNLVFTQFETLNDGSRIPLEHPCIDTGMGLERIAAVMQGVHSNYDIDLFKKLIEDIKSITKQDNPTFSTHNNVIADHMRAICFMIADGITPSNEGRGYVLRRIIRRALRHGYLMGMTDPFLHKLVHSITNLMGSHYKELVRFEAPTIEILKTEEENFLQTIEKGMFILNSELKKIGNSAIFPAEIAYKLYNTHGFPIDLTQDILKSYDKKVDEVEFEKIVAQQKEQSKKTWAGTGDSTTDKIWYNLKSSLPTIEFLRDTISAEATILAIVQNNQLLEKIEASKNITYIISDKTPFYPESGGQAGDVGYIYQTHNNVVKVLNTFKMMDIHVHECLIEKGIFVNQKPAKLEINSKNRMACSRNHTATHMLQKALQEVFGKTVVQKGSKISADKLRFDFIYNGTIENAQLKIVEQMVNDNIDKCLPVKTKMMSLDQAISSGAMALFGEKYPDNVRVVTIGEDWSKELCGGEHVKNTMVIKCFKIIGISSIGSGIKRIEAITGDNIRKYLESEIEKMSKQIAEQQIMIKNLNNQKTNITPNTIDIQEDKMDNGITFISSILTNANHKDILHFIDTHKSDSTKKIILIANKITKNDTASICLFSNTDIDAIALIGKVAQALGITIKCGGRKDLAQAGGLPSSILDNFIKITKGIINP